jgi:mannose-1-phosphate guanylyltransferase
VTTALERDPDAIVVVLPSDHHIADDAGFARSVRRAIARVRAHDRDLVLLGALPERIEDGYGWIVPDDRDPTRVAAFREKPPPRELERLVERGALVNTFVLVATARAVSWTFARWAPRWWAALAVGDVDAAYTSLPATNVSSEVLERAVEQLRVMPLGDVGWTDVGTPDRLGRVLYPTPYPARSTAFTTSSRLAEPSTTRRPSAR